MSTLDIYKVFRKVYNNQKSIGGKDMTFWITASILLFIIVMLSTFGPMFGLYGEMKYTVEGKENKDEHSLG